jgi:3-hydroxyisobutyrate dehydrogenase
LVWNTPTARQFHIKPLAVSARAGSVREVSTVAVLGLGAMGSRIARRLLDAGHELVVWNRTPSKADELVALGAARADTPADAAARAEAVLTMLADPGAVRDVTEGSNGIAAGAGEGTTVIEMSTVGPAAIARLRVTLPEAVGLLDAPVLGSLPQVEAGALRVFVGGPEALAERWLPLLSELGTPMHVGPLGSGAAAKLVANTTLFGSLGVLGEALALAQGLGLERKTAFDVLAATPIAAQAERRREAIESGEYPPRFSLALAKKDADLVAEAAASAGVELRLAAAARSWLADADQAGWADLDYAVVLERMLGRR